MKLARPRLQAGFTLIELMITVAIIGILASIALTQYRDYTRRAKMSEVILATGGCKTRISESYLSLNAPPAAGGAWGCEAPATTRYAAALQTSIDGAIRITIGNLDPGLNGMHVHLVPVQRDGSTALQVASALGDAVPRWVCGSNESRVRNALPADCRVDTTPYAVATFE